MSKYLAFKDFVETALIGELSSLMEEGSNDHPVNNIKYRYHIFILIAVGIETLGAALDKYAWHYEKAGSKKRFNKALSNYQSLKKYTGSDLYSKLRCGMAHVYVPRYGLGINMKSEGGAHNKINNRKLLLHIEDFFNDFIEACQELVDNIDEKKNTLSLSSKAYKDIFLEIPD
jgi:hypothetical protein